MKKVTKSDNEWRRDLTDEQYKVLRQGVTERPFTGKFVDFKDNGDYSCAACGITLFSSDTKYNSHCGWPSFYDIANKGNIELKEDTSHGMTRTEVICSQCHSHLGHLFDDGPQEKTGLRYCINSAALDFKPES